MAYSTYTTKALVCGTWDRNTADKSYLLFTREAGMLYADARSARLEKSKQRFALQDFSLVRVSLVRGKAGWRIGSVEAIKNYYQSAIDKAARGSIVAVCRTLRRFYSGEEPAVQLFDGLLSDLDTLEGEVSDRSTLENIARLRILVELGYVDQKRLPSDIFRTVDAKTSLPEAVQTRVSQLIQYGIDSSQL